MLIDVGSSAAGVMVTEESPSSLHSDMMSSSISTLAI